LIVCSTTHQNPKRRWKRMPEEEEEWEEDWEEEEWEEEEW
jgi:hypothetical protein